MEKFAIVSVWDKTGIEDFAQMLIRHGYTILSTGGTAHHLSLSGVPHQSISDYTGHPEFLGGRVKTLHPKVHGGILARRDREDDLFELTKHDVKLIDFVVVNLYPFTDKVEEVELRREADHKSLVEYIDIGGPTMIRAAAKNCEFVVPVCDPHDYQSVATELESTGEISPATRQFLASKVFRTMAAYDGAVARYFSLGEKLIDRDGEPVRLAPIETFVLEEKTGLRYGENPHQRAGFYQQTAVGKSLRPREWEQLQGKELSYNNLLDSQAALDLLMETIPAAKGEQTAVIIKHSNPCGVALRSSLVEAFRESRRCDPISAFGGIIALSGVVGRDVAEAIIEGFVEVVLAADYEPEALSVFGAKKNIRVMRCDLTAFSQRARKGGLTVRTSLDGFLVQTGDNQLAPISKEQLVCGLIDENNLRDLDLAWRVCKHVKSNAIVIAKNQTVIGVGAGQMSRVDAAKIAIQRALLYGHDLAGSAAASDAFLPFPDTLEVLNDAGVTSLVQPGGSLRDMDVVEAAKLRHMTMVFTGERHFRH